MGSSTPHIRAVLGLAAAATLYFLGSNAKVRVVKLIGSLPKPPDRKRNRLRPRGGGDGDDGRRAPRVSAIDVPECARDVILALRGEGSDGNDGRDNGCVGMLIRDDIVLTSRDCATRAAEFEFPGDGVGVVRAVPSSARFGVGVGPPTAAAGAAAAAADPRLGFLAADPPAHYAYADVPTRRTRMFLSERTRASANETTGLVVTCVGLRPVAHGFPVGDEVVPLGDLSDVLPDDVLWEGTDLDSAPMLEDGSRHRWWTRAVTREEQEGAFREFVEGFDGPPGSLSVPRAHSDKFVSRASSVCEALDPRGHRQHCFKNYFYRWYHESPFSGTRFFDWLDFGGGKSLIERNDTRQMIEPMKKDERCTKEIWNKKQVKYLTKEEKEAHEIYLTPSSDDVEVIARFRQNDRLVPRSDPEYPQHIFMWDMDEKFYIIDELKAKEMYGKRIHHTTLLAGGPALCAGYLYFGDNGRLTGINWASGHYRPDMRHVSLIYQWMKGTGFNVTSLDWVGMMAWSADSCEEYDWDAVKIPGHDAGKLRDSCHEVTTGPTWIQSEEAYL